MKQVKVTDFRPDPRNANKGTERGRGLIEKSLTELGAGRSILVDKNNVTIAGNKTLEVAAESGIENAIVVETDGSQLVIVKRTDLDLLKDKKAKKLAVADNRAGEVSLSWDVVVLAELDEEINLSEFWSEAELAELLDRELSQLLEDEPQGGEKAGKEIFCECPECGHSFIKVL